MYSDVVATVGTWCDTWDPARLFAKRSAGILFTYKTKNDMLIKDGKLWKMTNEGLAFNLLYPQVYLGEEEVH